MAYIGKTPTVGNFQVCDAISVVNGQAAYTLQVGGSNVEPESANHMLVSLNGILQKPGSSFTISGSTMTFASNLATGDVIDFVTLLGNVLDIGQPSDDTVTAAKLNNDIISGQTALTSAPASTDEFLVSDAGVLKRIDASLVGRGKVLQVVTGETTTNTQITSSSYADTSLTADITPSATSSKILVLVSQNIQMERATYEINTFLQLLRDSTTISIKTVGVSTGASNSQGCRHTFAISHLDEPSTTSAITYKTQGKINDTANSGTCRFQEGGSRSEIVLIEIAG